MKSAGSKSALGILTATIIGFAATSITIVSVPLILTEPAMRSPHFWQRIAWTEFLAALVWSYIGGFFSLVIPKHRSIRGLGAVLPALGIAIFFYAASSFILMMIAAYLPHFSSLNMASQIYKTTGLVIIVVFLFFSWITGIADSQPIPPGIRTPKELIISLQREENALLSQRNLINSPEIADKIHELRISLKGIREKVQYSIPHAGRIGANNGYIDFSNAINKLCEDCSKLDASALNSSILQSIIQRASALSSEVQVIAQTLRQ